MAKKGILITGGSGLIGAYTVRMLQERGERPVVFSVTGNKRLLGAVGTNLKSLSVVRGDVLDLPALTSTIREHKIDRIIHLASYLGEEIQRRPYSGVRLNFLGTVHVLEVARLEGVSKVVFSSSAVVYRGSLKKDSFKMIDETVPPHPLSIYAAAKVGAEFVGQTYARRFGFEFIVVRFPALYGPSLTGLKATREQAIQAMVRAALRNEAATINWPYGPAEILYGKDAAKGAVLACLKDNVREHTFNIGCGELVSGDDFLRALKTHFPRVEISLTRGKNPMAYTGDRIPMDYSRSREQLGYEPEYPLDRALGDYAETLRKIEGL